MPISATPRPGAPSRSGHRFALGTAIEARARPAAAAVPAQRPSHEVRREPGHADDEGRPLQPREAGERERSLREPGDVGIEHAEHRHADPAERQRVRHREDAGLVEVLRESGGDQGNTRRALVKNATATAKRQGGSSVPVRSRGSGGWRVIGRERPRSCGSRASRTPQPSTS